MAATSVALRPQSALVSIGHVARACGVSTQAIRDWANLGLIPAYRLSSGHRRFNLAEVQSFVSGKPVVESTRRILSYCRVSTSNQAKNNREGLSNLTRQRDRLRKYATEKYPDDELIEFVEQGSSMNFLRKKLGQLLEGILSGKYDGSVLLVEFKDRLARFGGELIELICKSHNIEVVYVEQQQIDDQEMLTQDLLAIIFLFGIKMTSGRTGKRLRKEPTLECMTRAKELLQAGLSVENAVIQLKQEGHDCTNWTIRVYVARPMEKLQKTIPTKSMNSAQEYFREFSQCDGETSRVSYTELFKHYQKWAKSTGKVAVSVRRLCAEFNSSYASTFHNGKGNCYKGLKIKGADIAFSVRKFKERSKSYSELDYLLKFYNEIKGKTLTEKQIMDRYRTYARAKEIKPMDRESVISTLKQLGATPIKKNRVLALVC